MDLLQVQEGMEEVLQEAQAKVTMAMLVLEVHRLRQEPHQVVNLVHSVRVALERMQTQAMPAQVAAAGMEEEVPIQMVPVTMIKVAVEVLAMSTLLQQHQTILLVGF